MVQFVLASGSPRRKELLERVGLEFSVRTSEIEEQIEENMPPYLVVEQLALQKAADVAKTAGENTLVIGADTIVVLDGEILTKPHSEQEAADMLRKLSGRSHSVLTGLSVIRTDDALGVSVFEETKVFFRTLTEEEIACYIKSGEPLDKAGAYGIQGRGSMLIEKIEGDYFNVVGLPLCRLCKVLKDEFEVNLILEVQ